MHLEDANGKGSRAAVRPPAVSLRLVGLVLTAILSLGANNNVPPPGSAQPGVVAEVNDEAITRSELTAALTLIYGDDVLRQLINTKLLEQEAKRAGPAVLAGFQQELRARINREVEAYLQQLARTRGYRTLGEFERELDRVQKGSYARLKEHHAARIAFYVKPRLLGERILSTRIKVTDEDIRAAYERAFGPKVLIRQIVVRTRVKAEEILNRLRSGADFGQMASENSIDPVSSQRGGLVEPLPDEGILGKAAFALKPGALSGVMRTDEGYHILKSERKIRRRPETLADVRDLLREQLLRREIERRIPDLLLEIRQKSTVKVDDR